MTRQAKASSKQATKKASKRVTKRATSAGSTRPRLRKYLTEQQYNQNRKRIVTEVAAVMERTGAHGWCVRGTPKRLRVVMRVAERLFEPEAAVGTIPLKLAGQPVQLKLAVETSLEHLLGAELSAAMPPVGTPVAPSTERRLLSPGGTILVADEQRQRGDFGGVAAIIKIEEQLHLLTCGHLFGPGRRSVFVPGQPGPVAKLRRNFRFGSSPIDFAIARLTGSGRTLLERSPDGRNWTRLVLRPTPAVHDQKAVLWCSRPTDMRPKRPVVQSCDAAEPLLFAGDAGERLVKTELCSKKGDSGAPLTFRLADGRITLLGLCSGAVGTSSFFTAARQVFDRLQLEFGKDQVKIWTPDS